VACVYGGSVVADQIAKLKRGADIVVCTPGRMIDILCTNNGHILYNFNSYLFIIFIIFIWNYVFPPSPIILTYMQHEKSDLCCVG